MDRRDTVLALLALGAAPFAAEAQQAAKIPRIGYLTGSLASGLRPTEAFRQGLRDLGYVEGRNVVFVSVDPGTDRQRLAAAVNELIRLEPDVLVAWGSDARALHAKTKSIPIVLTGGFDPVGAGLALSLGRPGMNVTGVTQLNTDLPAKHVEILSEILPKATRIGMLFDENASGCALVERSARAAAERIGRVFVTYRARNKADIERAFAQMEGDRPDALLPCPSPVLYNHRALLFSEGLRLRVPWSSFIVANVPLGVLFAHSSSRQEEYRKAAIYVDRILKGASPAELPIEQPSRFELVVNLKTAKALGIEIPRSVLLRADRVIE